MGSSTTTCLITGVDLQNEPAVFIPLVPNAHSHPRDYPTVKGVGMGSNEGAMGLYSPLTLPIFGSVGDTGEFDIEEDEHTRWLETRLKSKTQDLVDATLSGKTHPQIDKIARRVFRHENSPYMRKSRWHGMLRGCMILKEAWDKFSETTWYENGGVKDLDIHEWLSGAKKRYLKDLVSQRRNDQFYLESPELAFHMIEDNTPPEERERQADLVRKLVGRIMKREASDPSGEPEPKVEIPGLRQTFCDYKFHVTLHGISGRTDPTGYEIYPCDSGTCRKCSPLYVHRINFTDKVWSVLKTFGWKPKPKSLRSESLTEFRMFAPETLELYGARFVEPENLARLEPLLVFSRNLYAANRMFEPSLSGNGNAATQAEVAKLILKRTNSHLTR